MICVEWTCPSVAKGSATAELSAGVVEANAVAEAGDRFTNAGMTGDGGKVAVHPSYPIMALREEYALFRKTLNSAVLDEAFFLM